MLARVSRIWNAESEFEVERFQKLVSKKMLLDHSKLIHGSTSHSEFNPVNIMTE